MSTILLIYESWVTNMDREMIPCAVGTTEYLIINEQVMVRVVLRLVNYIGSSPMIVS